VFASLLDAERFAIQIEPRFDYGRMPHTVEISDHGSVFRSDGLELTMHGIGPAGSSVRDLGITAPARQRRPAMDPDAA
jgi:hypothetical protein